MEYEQFASDLLDKGGFWVQRNREAAELILDVAVEMWPSKLLAAGVPMSRVSLREWVLDFTRERFTELHCGKGRRFGSGGILASIALSIILNYVLPRVIDLLINWWTTDREANGQLLGEWRS